MKSASSLLLELQGLSHSFDSGTVPVLNSIDLTVQAGETVGLLGPNGSGKTTLLKLCCGVLQPRAGRVLLEGRPLAGYTPAERARCIAVVPQDTSFPFPCSVSEVVLLGRSPWQQGRWWESREDRRLAGEAMARVGVEHLATRSIATLSGGERQRVLVARALAQQPRLLLLDEPTASLDLHHQLALVHLVRELAATGRFTVLAALHDLNLASQLCSRVVLLRQGEVRGSGSPGELLTAETVEQVFGVRVHTGRLPGSGCPFLIPLA